MTKTEVTVFSFGGGQDSFAILYKIVHGKDFRDKYVSGRLVVVMAAVIWDKDAYNQYKRIVGSNDGEVWNHLYMGIDYEGKRTNPVDRAECSSFSLLTFEEFCKTISEAPSYEYLVENYSCEDYVLGDVGKNYSYQWRNFGGKTDQIGTMRSATIRCCRTK